MSITAITEALQDIHAGIDGIASAPQPAKYRAAIDTGDLPLVLTWPGPSEWGPQALGLNRSDRTYIVRVYVEPIGQGTLAQRTLQIMPLLDAIGQAYLNDRSLGGAVDHIGGPMGAITDTGAVVLPPLAGIEYAGFEFRVPVTEKIG